MAYRTFFDSKGVEWATWDVLPMGTERRSQERRASEVRATAVERRLGERRFCNRIRSLLRDGLAAGWLCFDGGAQRRRLAPIPADWSRCPDQQLEEYCRAARPVALHMAP